MQLPLISIVIPVYNTSSYLDRCLRSVMAQDYPNYEVIIVDDGSLDDSLARCRRYESDNTKVFTKPNSGPAETRNFGLDKCSPKARYVAFVDSDDEIKSDYLSNLYSTPGDLKVCSLRHKHPDGSIDIQAASSGTELLTDLPNNHDFARRFENGIFNSPCNKLFSLDIIRSHNLRFKSIRIMEDIDFVVNYLHHCVNVGFTPAALYTYIHRDGSETSRVSTEMYDNYIRLHTEMLQWFNDDLEPEINRFVYPQYMAITLRFLSNGDTTSPRPYLKNPLIMKAFASHECGSMGERVMHTLIKSRILGIAKRLFL